MPTAIRVTLALVLAITLLLLLTVVALRFFDWSVLKDELAAVLSERLGAHVEIAGDLEVDVGKVVHVQANDVRLVTPAPARDPLLTLERIRLAVELRPLLRGRIVVANLDVIEPRVIVARNAAGEINWSVLETNGEQASALPVVRHFHLERGTLIYRDAALRNDIRTEIDRLEASISASGRIAATGAGAIEGRALTMRAEASRLEQRQGWRVDAAVGVADARFDVAGVVPEPDLEVELRVPHVAQLDFLSLPEIPAIDAVYFQSRLTRDQDHWWLDDLDLYVDGRHLNGDVRVNPAGDLPMIYATLYLDELPLPETRERPARAELIAPVPIDVGPLRQVNARANLRVGRLRNSPIPMRDIALSVRLQNGRLALTSVSARVAGGRLQGEAVLDGRQSVPSAAVEVTLHNLQLQSLFPALPREALRGTMSGRIDLAGSGNNLEDLAASAQGQIIFLVKDGAIRKSWVEAVRLDLAQWLFLEALPGTQTTQIRCGFLAFTVEDGVLLPRPVLLDTRDSWVIVDGFVDLEHETLQLTLRAHPKDFSPLSARAPVTVVGPFDDLAVNVATERLLGRGAMALALGGLLGPIAGLIPFLEPGIASDMNCKELLAGVPLGEAAAAAP